MTENPRNGGARAGAPQSSSTRRSEQRQGLTPVADPRLSDDGLALTGPGAPSAPPPRGAFSSFRAGQSEHPVRARLLEKSRLHSQGEAAPEPDQEELPTSPASAAPASTSPASAAPASTSPASAAPASTSPASAAPAKAAPSEQPPEEQKPREPVSQPSEAQPARAQASEAPPSSAQPSAAPALLSPALLAAAQPRPAALGPSGQEAPLPPESLLPTPDEVAREEALLTPPPGAVMSELDRIARSSPRTPGGPELSPNLTALLGALLGLTVIVSLGLLLSKSEAPLVPSGATTEVDAAPPAEDEAEEAKPQEEAPREVVKGPWRVQDDANKPGHKLIAGKIGSLAFLRAIQDAGLPKSQAYRAYTALKGLLDLDHCHSKDTFLALVVGKDKTLLGFEYIKSKEEVYQAKPNEKGHLEGAQLDLKVERNQIRRAFAYDGKSFEESAQRAGFDSGISDVVATALRGHGALGEFKAGDRLRIIAQEVTVLGEFSRYAGVEAMEIARPGGEARRYYYYPHPIEGGYFDKNGKAPFEGGWRKPIVDAPITSKFNMTRMHPVLNRVMPHTGTDFGAPTGTPIGATSPGTVSFVGPAGPNGNFVRIKHAGGYESGYSHLSRFEPGLKVGDHVDRLQIIGYCGSTGRSTGPHLHFTIKKDGKFIDPESMNLDGMRVLPKDHRNDFAEVRAKYDPILDEIPLPKLPVQVAAKTEASDKLSESSDNLSEMGDSFDEYGEELPEQPDNLSASADKLSKAAAAPTSAASAPANKGAPAKKVEPSAIFLTDKELLQMQGLTDPGEVAP